MADKVRRVKPKPLVVCWIGGSYSSPELLGVVPEGTKPENIIRPFGLPEYIQVWVGSIQEFVEDVVNYRTKEHSDF